MVNAGMSVDQLESTALEALHVFPPEARAAVRELATQARAKEPAGTYARITELQAINAQMTRHRDEQAARAEAAETDRDRLAARVAELERENKSLRDDRTMLTMRNSAMQNKLLGIDEAAALAATAPEGTPQ